MAKQTKKTEEAKSGASIQTTQQLGITNYDTQEVSIEHLIYVFRGKQVMLDKDLAMLYLIETGQLNRQVKRNIERFPNDFMFRLSKEEMESLKCQNGISSWGGNGLPSR